MAAPWFTEVLDALDNAPWDHMDDGWWDSIEQMDAREESEHGRA